LETMTGCDWLLSRLTCSGMSCEAASLDWPEAVVVRAGA
jgi:hypothetical protein